MKNPEAMFSLTEKLLTYALILFAIAGISIPLYFKQYNLVLLGIYLAVPMILAPLIHLMYRNKKEAFASVNDSLFTILLSLFLFCFSYSLILLYLTDVRPLAYYGMVSLLATIIFIQIALNKIDDKRVLIVLIEIVVLTFSLLGSANLYYYFFIGRTDSLGHVANIESLIRYSHVTDAFDIYKPFPLWHILVASLYKTLGLSLPVHRLMFLANDLIYSFMVPFVYLLAMRIFKDRRTSLFAAFLISIFPDFIFYGQYAIPRSLTAFPLEVMLITLLLYNIDVRKVMLLVILSFSITLYHTASIPFIISIFALAYVMQKIYSTAADRKIVTANYLWLMFVSTLFYWMYYARQLFLTIINDIIRQSPSDISTKAILYTPKSELVNYLQYSPFLFLVIIGTLAALRSNAFLNRDKALFMTGLFMTAFSFPGPSLLINKLAKNFNLARFGEYSLLFIILASTMGLATTFYKSSKYVKAVIIIFIFITAFLSISNDFVASDNPLMKRPFYTFYLTNEEITSFDHAANFTKGYLMADYVTSRYVENMEYKSKRHILEVNVSDRNIQLAQENMRFLRNSSLDVLLVRKGEQEKRPLSLYTSTSGFILRPSWGSNLDYYYEDLPLWRTLGDYNRIYESNHVVAYN